MSSLTPVCDEMTKRGFVQISHKIFEHQIARKSKKCYNYYAPWSTRKHGNQHHIRCWTVLLCSARVRRSSGVLYTLDDIWTEHIFAHWKITIPVREYTITCNIFKNLISYKLQSSIIVAGTFSRAIILWNEPSENETHRIDIGGSKGLYIKPTQYSVIYVHKELL